MKRRTFISLVGGAAAGWPLVARAQQPERMRRIGAMLPAAAGDSQFQTWFGAFLQGLQQTGWSIGRNLHIDTRWTAGNEAEARKLATELVGFAPDVLFCHGASTVEPMLQATRSIPIVFVTVSDPVGAGIIDSLARPGGNATGFMSFEFSIAGKWLELLKQVAPRVKRAGVVRDSSQSAAASLFAAIQTAAPSLGMEAVPVNARNASDFERSFAAFARNGGGGLVITPTGLTTTNRELIVNLASQYKLPAIYFERSIVTAGALISYGPDRSDQYRQAAGYVDRILKGAKPADLPVQAPTKYELVINLKTAKALGLTVPTKLLSTANEVIE